MPAGKCGDGGVFERAPTSPSLSAPEGGEEYCRQMIYRERVFGPINWIGLWTLYLKEVRRFLKVYVQTLLAPMVTTLLYLAVFLVALASRSGAAATASFSQFLAPGLLMMAMTQNAFANSSSSVTIAKVQGNIVDILMPPLSAAEVTAALCFGGATRGLMVGVVVALSMLPFVTLSVDSWGLVLFHGLAGSLLLSTIGVIGGLWSEKFDHIAAVTNFIVMPLTFLSGTFYSIERLPPSVQTIARLDPFFYMIDGFRTGFIGHGDASVTLGVTVMAVLNLGLLALTWYLVAIGYKIKS